jgi:hypothetical protein
MPSGYSPIFVSRRLSNSASATAPELAAAAKSSVAAAAAATAVSFMGAPITIMQG